MQTSTTPPRIIVHGGVWSIPDELVPAHKQGIQRALETVYPKLESGEINAQEAVVQVVCVFLSTPTN
jgi:beta-aspartyl-peptidase (threonine type)